MDEPSDPTARRAVAVGTATTVIYQLPLFFVGALAVSIGRELGFGSVGLGVAVGAHWLVFALASPAAGTVADALGAARALRTAALGAALASIGIAGFAHSWWTLVAGLVVVGLAGALGQPAANRLLRERVPPGRLGTAFGIKQSAPPVASMLAGLSVPVAALTLGWRATFVTAGVVAGLLALVIPRASSGHSIRAALRASLPRVAASAGAGEDPTPSPPRLQRRGVLVILGLGFAVSFATSTSLLAFLVDASVEAGIAESTAGTVLAAASVAAIVVRLVAGRLADTTWFDPLLASAGLLLVGALGIGVLALGGDDGSVARVTGGATLGLAGTWGFPGLFWFAVVRAYPHAPGRITGVLAPAMIGGTAGPAIFGWLAAGPGYTTAWLIGAVAAVAGAVAMLLGARGLPAHDLDGTTTSA